MTRVPDRLAAIAKPALDLLLALALGTALVLEDRLDPGASNAQRLMGTVAALLLVVPITVRRRWPAAALLAAAAVAAAQAPLGGDLAAAGVPMLVTIAVLAYALGNRPDARFGVAALALGGALFSIVVFHTAHGPLGWAGTELFVLSVAFAAPWLIGRVTHERGRRVAAFRALAAEANAAHDESERAAITSERDRIGRELEDIIAHSISAMVIQTGGARQQLRHEPERARNSILTVERTGREALTDLRRLLGMLRKDDDPRTLAPQPGLDQLAPLLASLRAQGLTCRLRTDGEQIDLTPGIDLVGYRLIEATLLSAAHERGGQAAVTLRYSPERLELEIVGDTPIPELERELHGMSERVALYQGNLLIVPSADGGFALHATLPLGTPVPA
jgi:signal transduction histidine kinase